MRLDESFEKLKFDARMKDWNLRQGFLTPQQLNDHLSKLSDCSNNAEKIDLEEGGSNGSSDYQNGNHSSFGSNGY